MKSISNLKSIVKHFLTGETNDRHELREFTLRLMTKEKKEEINRSPPVRRFVRRGLENAEDKKTLRTKGKKKDVVKSKRQTLIARIYTND